MKNKTVAVAINGANLLNALKQSFTNSETFIGELMQNARRANATCVKFCFDDATSSLTIADDGCGIGSFDKLLTIGESGWDAALAGQEHPFGIGFLSALCACEHIQIISKGGEICMGTDKILSMEAISLSRPNENYRGTFICMKGVSLDRKKIFSTLEKLSKGFPIDVELDGHVFERPHAIDGGFIETDIGHVRIMVEDYRLGHSCYLDAFTVYLQGLPIYRSTNHVPLWNRDSACNTVHLGPAFRARLPDRDKLVDEEESVKSVREVLQREVAASFTKLKSAFNDDPAYLASFYPLLCAWGLRHLLNDVKALPIGAVETFVDYPNCETSYFGHYLEPFNGQVTEDILIAREIVSLDEDIQTQGALCHLFAMEKDRLVYRDGFLDKGHWIHGHIKWLEKPSVKLINESHTAPFHEDYVWTNVRFCEAYEITIGDESVTVTAHSVYLGEGGDIIAVRNDNTGQVLSQAWSFTDGNDNYQEDGYNNEVTKFFNFIVANRCDDPVDAIRQLLPDKLQCHTINNKSFVLSVDGNGKLSITGLASPEPDLANAA